MCASDELESLACSSFVDDDCEAENDFSLNAFLGGSHLAIELVVDNALSHRRSLVGVGNVIPAQDDCPPRIPQRDLTVRSSGLSPKICLTTTKTTLNPSRWTDCSGQEIVRKRDMAPCMMLKRIARQQQQLNKHSRSPVTLDMLPYEMISNVLETWDASRSVGSNDFDLAFGMLTFQRLFEMEPEAMKVFGYSKKGSDFGTYHATVHAAAFAGLFDSVFQMLRPDISFVRDALEHLGRVHKAMGVSPHFFLAMGEAVIYALETCSGITLTKEQRNAWTVVYEAVTHEILK